MSIDKVLKSIAPESGIIPHVNNMTPEQRYELFSLAAASGDAECIAHLMEKLIGDHALADFIQTRSYENDQAKHYGLLAFESAIFTALEAPIQDAIDRYNQEARDLYSLTGDPLIDAGHNPNDFS